MKWLEKYFESRASLYINWALVAVWAGVIFCMSANSGSDLNQGSGLLSRVFQYLTDVQAQLLGDDVEVVTSIAHFCEYAVLGALLVNALGRTRSSQSMFRVVLVAVVCASLYGVSDELHQLFVPDRMCDPVDWVVDTLGALTGGVLAARLLDHWKLVTFSKR